MDVNAARERGAEVGEKMAVAAEKMKESAAEAALTSKIKAKMVLDDYIKARAIDVTTSGTAVTMSGDGTFGSRSTIARCGSRTRRRVSTQRRRSPADRQYPRHSRLSGAVRCEIGVGDGYRTRDLLSHSQAFYH